jgi:hypothetical protein
MTRFKYTQTAKQLLGGVKKPGVKKPVFLLL